MLFLFKKKYLKSAEGQGWILVADNSADLAAHSVRTIVDAGTGNGERLAYFLDLFPYAMIHCFEPGSKAFAWLEKHYKKHRRVILNCMALCGSSGLAGHQESIEPCHRPKPFTEDSELTLPGDYLVKTTLDDYCRVCGIKNIDILRLPGTATDGALFNGAREQLAEGRIRSMLIPFKPGISEEQAKGIDIATLNKGLEHQGFELKGVRGSRDKNNKFSGHMFYLKQQEL